MRPFPLFLAALLALQTVPVRSAAASIAWQEPAYQDLELAGDSPLRSPWDDIREHYGQWQGAQWKSPAANWDALDSDSQADLLRKAYSLYVGDLSKLESSGRQDRAIYDSVTPERVLRVKKVLGDDSARALAAVRSRLIVRRYDESGVLVSQGLEWLDVFDKEQSSRIRADIAKRRRQAEQAQRAGDEQAKDLGRVSGQLGDRGRLSRSLAGESGMGKTADGSVDRAELPETSVVAARNAPSAAPRRASAAPEERFEGEGAPRLKSVKTFSDAPPAVAAFKTQGKTLYEIDRDRANGIADVALGVMVGGVGAFVFTVNPWAGGVIIAGGAGLIIYGIKAYRDNDLTDEQRRELPAH
jgi:hypothetical protein